MSRGLFFFALFWLVFLPKDSTAEVVGKKGRIHGESYVNLRSGPDLSHPPRAVLKEGEQVTVEGEEGSWYLVSLMDGRKGYVHKTLVHLSGGAEVKESLKGGAVTAPSEEIRKDLPISPPQQAARQKPKGRPMPIIKVLEGKEWEILWWLGVALCIFIIGWICGGNYYLYRDRIKRTKLRF